MDESEAPPNAQFQVLDPEKGERLRTEEEMEEVREEFEKFDLGLFFDPRKIACFQSAFLTGVGVGAVFALIQRHFAS